LSENIPFMILMSSMSQHTWIKTLNSYVVAYFYQMSLQKWTLLAGWFICVPKMGLEQHEGE